MNFIGAIIHDRLHPPKDTKPSFAGRNVIVTGANVGVGFEAAVKFVQLGAERLIMGVRSQAKGDAAKAQIEARTGRTGVVEVWLLDMLDYDSLKAFSERANTQLVHLDIACLNAGMVPGTHELSKYGFETTLQVNLLSTVLLAILLLPKLKASKTAEFTPVLEMVSSGNHYYATIPEEGRVAESPLEFFSSTSGFSQQRQYNTSKLFLQYAQRELIKAIDTPDKEPDVEVVTICPGATKSALTRNVPGVIAKVLIAVLGPIALKPTEQGARTYISGVALQGKGHGKFWRSDNIDEPAPLLVGEANIQFQQKVWFDVVRALTRDVPEVQYLLANQRG